MHRAYGDIDSLNTPYERVNILMNTTVDADRNDYAIRHAVRERLNIHLRVHGELTPHTIPACKAEVLLEGGFMKAVSVQQF